MMDLNKIKPKVSVCVVTYNQEKYLRQCLQSLVDQKTDFNFEVIVGDDCSTDGTSKIVTEYEKEYPSLIIPVLHNKNIGAVANIISVYKKARGNYIAHLDGDDFAFAGKLQTQVDILERHPDCVICSHDMEQVDENSKLLSRSYIKHKDGVNTLIDLYQRLPFFAHSSKMFINNIEDKFYENLSKNTIDIEIHVEQAKKGNIYHIDESLGVYRVNCGMTKTPNGVNALLPAATRRIYFNALKNMKDKIEGVKLKRYFSKSILNYAYQSALLGREKECRAFAWESISIKLISILQILIWVLTFFPGAVHYLANTRKKLHN